MAGTTGSSSALAGNSFSSTVAITRPSNTTAYSAGSVIGAAGFPDPATAGSAVLAFTNAAQPNSGNVLIQSASLEIDVNSVPSGMANMRLHLYSATPPSALLDGAAWDLPSGDRSAYLGYIDIGSPVDMGSTLWVETNSIGKMVKAAAASLYGYLQTTGAYTPTSGAVKKITLNSIAV